MRFRVFAVLVISSLLLSPSVVAACAAWLCPPAAHQQTHGGGGEARAPMTVAEAHAGHVGHHDAHASHARRQVDHTQDHAPHSDSAPDVLNPAPAGDCCVVAAMNAVVRLTTRSEMGATALVALSEAAGSHQPAPSVIAVSHHAVENRPPLPATTIRVLRI